jgi:hypothetical protein
MNLISLLRNKSHEYLKQYVNDDEVLLKSNVEANSLIKKTKLEIEKLFKVIFDGLNVLIAA